MKNDNSLTFPRDLEEKVYEATMRIMEGHPQAFPISLANLFDNDEGEVFLALTTPEKTLAIFHGVLRSTGYLYGGLVRLCQEELNIIKYKADPDLYGNKAYDPLYLNVCLSALVESINIFRNSENTSFKTFEDFPSLESPLRNLQEMLYQIIGKHANGTSAEEVYRQIGSLVRMIFEVSAYINRAAIVFMDNEYDSSERLVKYEDAYLTKEEREMRAPKNEYNQTLNGVVNGPVVNGEGNEINGSYKSGNQEISKEEQESQELARQNFVLAKKGFLVTLAGTVIGILALLFGDDILHRTLN